MNKLSEVLAVSLAGAWVSMANYRQVTAVGGLAAADVGEGVSVLLQKATDSAGTGAVDLGVVATSTSTVTDTNVTAMVSAFAADMGFDGAGLPYTHVTAVITATGSPAPTEDLSGVVLRSDGRFSE